ncbi:MAG: NAD-dependent epimerase/dehydratase family protein [Candidatus Micrarchaeota archaeon]
MQLKGKRVLVTGGLGFIGSHIIDRLVNKCEELIIFDNYSSGNEQNIATALKTNKAKMIRGDILNYPKLKEAMNDVDLVVHNAAELEVFTGIQNMGRDLQINALGTVNVIEACLNTNVKKLIYASSGTVYGQTNVLPKETFSQEPHWPYGVSKLAGEKYCSMAWNLYKFPTVSLRYSIVYGPREWYGRVLTLFIKRALEGKSPVVFGDGAQTRDFVYVDDVADANISVIEKSIADGKVFNIGSGTSTTIAELANLVCELINPTIKPIFDNPPEGKESVHQPGRKRLIGELKKLEVDIDYAKEILDFNPKTNLKTGIEKEIKWLQENSLRWNTKPRV